MITYTTIANSLILEEPFPLPFCTYPTAADAQQHGVQPLPATLPLVDFRQATLHRSQTYSTVPASTLTQAQVLDLIHVMASAFARREPQCRHLRPALNPPAELAGAIHSDAFGSASFGPWSMETLLGWLIRLCILTDPTSPRSAIQLNHHALHQSLAIVDRAGRILGGAINETMPPVDVVPEFRQDDPFLAAALATVEPVFKLLGAQDAEAITALCDRYPEFAMAYADGKVGHHFMVARSDALPKSDAFELVAASAEHYQALGFMYMLVEATNQWTGSACETLGGVRVHFAPFRAHHWVQASAEPLIDVVTSPDGFLAAKDSGSMFYVLRLA